MTGSSVAKILNLQEHSVYSTSLLQPWPEDALEMVANKFLDDVEMTNHVREQSVIMCKHFHESVRALSQKYFDTMRR